MIININFFIVITNKTKNDIRVIWNDSYFIDNGQANGGFMFEGIRYIDRNTPKQDWLIFPNSSASKTVVPCEKIVNFGYDRTAEQMGLPTGWYHAGFGEGRYG